MERGGNGARGGFSLVVVLIIAIIGLAMVGATLQMTMTSSGAGRVASATGVKYNFLQDAVEEGKAALKRAMSGDLAPPRFFTDTDPSPADGSITEADDLLIEVDFGAGTNGIVKDLPLDKRDLGRLGIAGDSGTLVVAIYDMQYKPSWVHQDVRDRKSVV
jgi:type II secretory pathway pseudopilin PulG